MKKGYSVQVFVDFPVAQLGEMSAEEFLKRAWAMFTSIDELADSFCVLAKIKAPDSRSVCLRMDRDYCEVYKNDSEGITTLGSWQFSSQFRGFSKAELWCNMVFLLNHGE